MQDLHAQFGDIDIYLFDQLLKGRITKDMRVVDAGCGYGRNLVYLLSAGFQVFGVDADPRALASVRELAGLQASHFHVSPVEAMPFADAFADVILSSAVLHFARSDDQFHAMLNGMWRVLKPGGLFFCRLASSIGIEGQIRQLRGRIYLLPDGSERYLVDEPQLLSASQQLGGVLLDPLKTTVVQNQRSMTTWVLVKNRPSRA
jgi:tellurite methyltransferase